VFDVIAMVLCAVVLVSVLFWELVGRYEWALLCGDLDDATEWVR
jgi:hypothetical protein